jgi:predicted PurR-regulated permease PerM
LADTASTIKLRQPRGHALINLAVATLIVTALYFAREVLVPVALAVLFSFVLAPFVIRLQSWRVPRTLSVLVAVFIGFSIIFSLGGLMVSQANRLAEELPGYQQTLQEKIHGLRGVAAGGSSTLQRASKVLRELDTELQNPARGQPAADGLRRQPLDKPIPVEIRQPDPGTLTTLVAIIQPLIQPLATTGIVVVFVIFILLQRQDLRNRFIRLAGSQDMQRTTAALDDAGQRLSRLFLNQIFVNASFGLLIGIGLQLIGVPSAPLWGLVAMILRFVPYVGSPISAVFPLILAAAVGSGWGMLLMTAALFGTLQLIAGQVVEPLVYGRSSGLSPVAIVISASFWTWLWGPIGLVLATPLTVCLVVVGRHVDRLQFFDVLLGNEPALTPPQLIYQRMLAGDPIEASQQAQAYLTSASLEDYYNTIMLNGLRLAEADARLGRLDRDRIDRILSTVTEVVDDLELHEDRAPVDAAPAELSSGLARLEEHAADAEPSMPLPERWQRPGAVLCIPGAGKLDEASVLILAQMLKRRGIGAAAETADALSMSRFFSLDLSQAAAFCICYVGKPSDAMIQYTVRRLSKKSKGGRIIIALLGSESDAVTPATVDITTVNGDFGVVVNFIAEGAAENPQPALSPEGSQLSLAAQGITR